MTGEILDAILTKLNWKFSSQSRNVALLLDDAGWVSSSRVKRKIQPH